MSSATSESTAGKQPYPSLIAFDLDYTLWPLWIDTHVTGPLRRKDNTLNEVLDRYGDQISFYTDVPNILHSIRARGGVHLGDDDNTTAAEQSSKVIIAACSRTHAPQLANDCLKLLLVPPSVEHGILTPTPAIEFFDEKEIYPGSKMNHFKALHKNTGIPYTQMLFFDDEPRNAEVEKLGVTFFHCPAGLTEDVFNNGLRKWRRIQSKES